MRIILCDEQVCHNLVFPTGMTWWLICCKPSEAAIFGLFLGSAQRLFGMTRDAQSNAIQEAFTFCISPMQLATTR
jgi:hypothetical protein